MPILMTNYSVNMPPVVTPPGDPPFVPDYYAAPTVQGNGDGLSAANAFLINSFWSVASPGKKLGLLDGTYTGANSMVNPTSGLNGSSGNPITVRAINDGGVTINGQDANIPLNLDNNDWFVVQGFDAHNSSAQVVWIHATSANNAIKRVIAWQGGNGNWGVWGVESSANNLIEDGAGFGRDRGIITTTQGGNDVTFRRFWGMFEEQGTPSTGPENVQEGTYASFRITLENFIATWADSTISLNAYGILSNGFGASGDTFKTFGSILYVKASAAFAPGQLVLHGIDHQAPTSTYQDVVAYTAQSTKRPFDLSNTTSGTFANNTEIGGVASAIGTGWTITHRIDVDTVGEAPNIWNGAGTEGARVYYRYQDGVLTGTKLWPWPMDARIRAALTTAGKSPDTIFGGAGNSVTQQMEAIFGAIP